MGPPDTHYFPHPLPPPFPSTTPPLSPLTTMAVLPHLQPTWDVSPVWVGALGCAAIAEGALSGAALRAINVCYLSPEHSPHHTTTHHTTMAVRPHLPFARGISPAQVGALRCAAIAEGALSGAAQRALNACYLGGPLLPPQGHQVPGARAGSCSLRLSEVMGARTLPGPKPAKKRPMCSPPGAGRKGRERSPHAHVMIFFFFITTPIPLILYFGDRVVGGPRSLCLRLTKRAVDAGFFGGSLLPPLGQPCPRSKGGETPL